MRTWAPSLRHREFRVYYFGQMGSWVGSWLQQLALGWWAYKLSGSAAWLAAVAACAALPILLLGPWAASLADRIERRRGVMFTQALSLGHAVALGVIYALGWGEPLILAALALFLGAVSAFDIPLRQSYIARLVPNEDLKNAIAINAISANATRLGAPALGGFLIAAGGEGVCFWLNALSYLAILGSLAALPDQPPEEHVGPRCGALRSFAQGASYAASRPTILAAMATALATSLFAAPYLSLMPALVLDAFKAGPTLYGLTMGASGVGALAAGVFMAARPSSMGKAAMPWFGAGGSVALSAMAAMPNAWAAMPLLVLTGFGLAGGASSASALVQAKVDPAMRGRVMGLFSMCLYGSAPLGVLAMGAAAERFGVRAAMEVGGVLSAAGCVVLALGMRRAWSAKAARDALAPPTAEALARVSPAEPELAAAGEAFEPSDMAPQPALDDAFEGQGGSRALGRVLEAEGVAGSARA
jgi:MFS family permease